LLASETAASASAPNFRASYSYIEASASSTETIFKV